MRLVGGTPGDHQELGVLIRQGYGATDELLVCAANDHQAQEAPAAYFRYWIASPGTGFSAVLYSGQRVHVATVAAISSIVWTFASGPPNRSRLGVPTTRPGAASLEGRDSAASARCGAGGGSRGASGARARSRSRKAAESARRRRCACAAGTPARPRCRGRQRRRRRPTARG